MSTFPMPFKKLNPYIKEMLEQFEISEPTDFQSKSIPIIKSGANVYCTAKNETGKTTTLILTALQKLKCEAVGTSPRAFILVEDMLKAKELYEEFVKYTRYNSLRVYLADEKVHIDLQKSEIFEGVDILISTPKGMHTLFLQNGVNSSQLKMFCIDDADFLSQKNAFSQVLAITQSLPKCQFVLFSEKITSNLKRFEDYFMEYAKIVSV